MPNAYFDYSGTPVRLILDDDGLPDQVEGYDRTTGEFVLRDDLMPDVCAGEGAHPISEEPFERLLAEVREKAG